MICAVCGDPDTTYQAFSGGREYWCPTCGDSHPYPDGEAPPRAQMLADGRFDELRTEMRAELARRHETVMSEFGNNVWDVVCCPACDDLLEVPLGSNDIDTLIDHAPNCPEMQPDESWLT